MGGLLYHMDPQIEVLYQFLKQIKIDDFLSSDKLQVILAEFNGEEDWEWYGEHLSEKLERRPQLGEIFCMFLNQLYQPDYGRDAGFGFINQPPRYRGDKRPKGISRFLDFLDTLVLDLLKTQEVESFDVEGLIDQLRLCGIRLYEIKQLKFVKYRETDGLKMLFLNLYSFSHPLFFGTQAKSWKTKERKLFSILGKKFKNEYRALRGAFERYMEGGPDADRTAIEGCRNFYENFFKKINRADKWSKGLGDTIASSTLVTLIKEIYKFLSAMGTHSPKKRKSEDAALALHLTVSIMLRVLIEVKLIE